MKLIPKTGQATDQMNQDIVTAKSGRQAVLDVVVSGTGTTAANKTVSHGLERVPSQWRVVRNKPATGVTGSVHEPEDVAWATDKTITLNFPGDGSWAVAIE
jgi:hypothetical protein